jgi:ABC-type polysaccharide/polyol phosphate transport system ATPase subunit
MTDDKAIFVENVGKRFTLQRSGVRTLKTFFLEWVRRTPSTARDLWALREINFAVRHGEVLGIIGANGAGKSTLLSLLAGTMVPTEGRITTRGSISSLLELGAGFHPDLTGRENIFLYGATMGLSRRRMQTRFDAIVAFAGLESFIDQPVKHYSSGMYIRLGFAIAVEVDPEILLIDEVLAVGDAAFQRKCLKRMEAFREQGKTMLIISHDLPTIQSISDRILFLDHGRIMGDGIPKEIVEAYEMFIHRRNSADLQREWGTREVVLTDVEFRHRNGQKGGKFSYGESLTAGIRYTAQHRIENPVFGFAIADQHGRIVNGNNSQIERVAIPFIEGEGTIELQFDHLNLAKGLYLFSFSIHSWDHKVNYHRRDNSFPIEVESAAPFEGYFYLPCRWSVPGQQGV